LWVCNILVLHFDAKYSSISFRTRRVKQGCTLQYATCGNFAETYLLLWYEEY
jgi:hypothetical protein